MTRRISFTLLAALLAASLSTRGDAAEPQASEPTPLRACRWLRVSGVPFCAPDPTLKPYRADAVVKAAATDLAEGKAPAGRAASETGTTVLQFLMADRELVARTPGGWLLPAVDLYVQALRLDPRFFDAARARANLALGYYWLGFAPELGSERDDPRNPAAPLAAALLADIAVQDGDYDWAEQLFEEAAAAGGLARCLALSGRIDLALRRGASAGSINERDLIDSVCPKSMRYDLRTARIRARLLAARGDRREAVRVLEGLRPKTSGWMKGAILTDAAEVAWAAGDLPRATALYEELAHGDLGTRWVRGAILALARIAAEQGKVDEALLLLARLRPDLAVAARREVMVELAREALHRSDPLEAVALLFADDISPDTLPVEDQIRLAAGYREVGFVDRGEVLLEEVATRGAPLPPSFYEERAAMKLAAGDASGSLADLDALRPPGGTAPLTQTQRALEIRAHALLLRGEDPAAILAAANELAEEDPTHGRALRIEIAAKLWRTQPEAAVTAARAALDTSVEPPLAQADEARALRSLAEAAEKLGRIEVARAAFAELASAHANDASSADSAYRAARLAGTGAATDEAAAKPAPGAAYASVSESASPLAQRIAAAMSASDSLLAGHVEEQP